MALKTIRIKLKSIDQALNEAVSAMKAIQKGRRVKPRKGIYFENLEAVRSILTENRLSLSQETYFRKSGLHRQSRLNDLN